MYTLTSKRRSLGEILIFLMQFLLSKLISSHGKRIIFITSLYFEVVRLERLKTSAFTKLNDIMNLSSSEDALRLPAEFRRMVWGHTKIDSELSEEFLDKDISEERAKVISTRVVDLSPVWVRYDKRAMISDVLELIRKGGQLAEGQQLAAA